jgi:urease accessory protein UreE
VAKKPVEGEKKRQNRIVLTKDAKYRKIRRKEEGNGNVVLLQK